MSLSSLISSPEATTFTSPHHAKLVVSPFPPAQPPPPRLTGIVEISVPNFPVTTFAPKYELVRGFVPKRNESIQCSVLADGKFWNR